MWLPASAGLRMAKCSAAWPLATASAQGRPTAVSVAPSQRGDAGLEDAPGRVHDAGVDVADLSQRRRGPRRAWCHGTGRPVVW